MGWGETSWAPRGAAQGGWGHLGRRGESLVCTAGAELLHAACPHSQGRVCSNFTDTLADPLALPRGRGEPRVLMLHPGMCGGDPWGSWCWGGAVPHSRMSVGEPQGPGAGGCSAPPWDVWGRPTGVLVLGRGSAPPWDVCGRPTGVLVLGGAVPHPGMCVGEPWGSWCWGGSAPPRTGRGRATSPTVIATGLERQGLSG